MVINSCYFPISFVRETLAILWVLPLRFPIEQGIWELKGALVCQKFTSTNSNELGNVCLLSGSSSSSKILFGLVFHVTSLSLLLGKKK